MLSLDDIPLHARTVDTLTEDEMWLSPGPTVWRARRFVGSPRFYPVYRRGDRYSFSPIFLLADKRAVDLDREFIARVASRERTGTAYYSGTATIDREIERIGGPTPFMPTIFNPEAYAERLAAAMIADTAKIEAALPGLPHVILCGGKDSLNMLLLPWRAPVVALSAAPNYALVQAFIADNGLRIACHELRDEDRSVLGLEVLYNTCLSNLVHCRWGGELRAIAAQRRGRMILWQGQVATFLTPSWRAYIHYRDQVDRVVGYLESLVVRAALRLDTRTIPAAQQRRVATNLWLRGAMMQGSHMALLRALTGCVTLSGYHGPAVQAVVSSVDLSACVQRDIRPRVGRILRGREVVYPGINPGPPASTLRGGVSDAGPWIAAARASGLVVRGE
jgi:hypothetical protein